MENEKLEDKLKRLESLAYVDKSVILGLGNVIWKYETKIREKVIELYNEANDEDDRKKIKETIIRILDKDIEKGNYGSVKMFMCRKVKDNDIIERAAKAYIQHCVSEGKVITLLDIYHNSGGIFDEKASKMAGENKNIEEAAKNAIQKYYQEEPQNKYNLGEIIRQIEEIVGLKIPIEIREEAGTILVNYFASRGDYWSLERIRDLPDNVEKLRKEKRDEAVCNYFKNFFEWEKVDELISFLVHPYFSFLSESTKRVVEEKIKENAKKVKEEIIKNLNGIVENYLKQHNYEALVNIINYNFPSEIGEATSKLKGRAKEALEETLKRIIEEK